MMQTTLKPAMHFVAAILHILLAVLCNTSWEIRAKVQYLEYIHILLQPVLYRQTATKGEEIANEVVLKGLVRANLIEQKTAA